MFIICKYTLPQQRQLQTLSPSPSRARERVFPFFFKLSDHPRFVRRGPRSSFMYKLSIYLSSGGQYNLDGPISFLLRFLMRFLRKYLQWSAWFRGVFLRRAAWWPTFLREIKGFFGGLFIPSPSRAGFLEDLLES